MTGEYLLWDFDGTLAYRDGMWTDTLLSVLQRNNISNISKEDIRPLLNIGFTWDSPDSSHKDLFLEKIGGNTMRITLQKYSGFLIFLIAFVRSYLRK